MKKHQAFLATIPFRKRNPIIMFFAVLAAMLLYGIAAFMWYMICSADGVDVLVWITAIGTTFGGLCSTMTIITGRGEWMLIGLMEY